ncbi:hypothetical protein GCM10020001_023170 [Nonomuraea salmonea]
MRIPLGVRTHAGTVALLAVLTAVACLLVSGLPRTMQASYDEALRRSLAGADVTAADLTVTGAPAQQPGELHSRAEFAYAARRWRALVPAALRPLTGPGGHISAKTFRTPADGKGPIREFVNLGWLSDAGRRVDWVRGRAPGAPTTMRYAGGTIPVIEVGVVEEAESRMGLRVGETRLLGESVHTAVRIVGVFRAKDPADRAWGHDADVLHVTHAVPADGPEELHTTTLMADAGLAALADPTRNLTYRWVFPLDPRAANALSAPGVPAAVAEFRRQVDVQGTGLISYRLATGLPQLVTAFLTALAAAQTVLYLVLGGLFAVALGVIALAARLLTDRMERTLALARARGAALGQVVAPGTALTALTTGPAALAGYALAYLLPGPAPPIVHIGPLAVVVVTVAFAGTRVALAHRTPLRERRGDLAAVRPSARRVTVEALVVVLALAGAYLLRARGVSGTAQQDPYLLVIPVALTLAAALITLRCHPYPLRLLVRLAARGRAAVPFLGLARAARQRATGALPVLILLPALSLSVFAAVIHDGITATQQVASWQKVGAPIKLTAAGLTPETIQRVRTAPGVERVAPRHDRPRADHGHRRTAVRRRRGPRPVAAGERGRPDQPARPVRRHVRRHVRAGLARARPARHLRPHLAVTRTPERRGRHRRRARVLLQRAVPPRAVGGAALARGRHPAHQGRHQPRRTGPARPVGHHRDAGGGAAGHPGRSADRDRPDDDGRGDGGAGGVRAGRDRAVARRRGRGAGADGVAAAHARAVRPAGQTADPAGAAARRRHHRARGRGPGHGAARRARPRC